MSTMDINTLSTATTSSVLAGDLPAIPLPELAVSAALASNEARRLALQAQRARIQQELHDSALMVQTVEKDVSPSTSHVKVKNLDEWSIFVAAGATNFRPLLTRTQLHADASHQLSLRVSKN